MVLKSLKTGLLIAGLALVVACDSGSSYEKSRTQAEYDQNVVTVTASRSRVDAEVAPAPSPQTNGEAPKGGALLAYSYSMGISAPKQTVEPLMKGHQAACAAAGPEVCQVLGASANSYGEDQVSAYLNLRATPEWLKDFRETIASDAKGAGGKITSNTVNTEDLTNYIVDLDARLNAKTTLRDRIRTLLETNEGTLSDILEAERALANVQGEIDSMTAQLKAARARVSMSSLNISYQSDPETSVGVFKPLGQAFGDFGRASVQSLADAVRFIARAWPFFIIFMVVLAVLRWWWRGRRAK